MLEFVLIYMGISVILFFIYQLLNYWLYYMEENKGTFWFMRPISFISFILFLISFPIVGLMMYITDELYEKDREKKQRKTVEAKELNGKQIGYAHGKTAGFYEGFQEGYHLGCSTMQPLSMDDCSRFAVSISQQKGQEPDWCKLPKYHSRWSLDEYELTDFNDN